MPQSGAPELSIITVTYENPEGLSATLASLAPLRESGLAFEHLVVDSSPDRHRPVLKAYRAHPVRHFEEPPLGIYPAMNTGIRSAKGAFLWFLNGGDRLKSARNLQEAVATLRRQPSAELCYAAAALFRNGAFLHTQHPSPGVRPMLGINRVCHQAILYRASLFGRIGLFSEEYKLASDYELHLRAMAEGARTAILDLPIVEYDMDGQSSKVEPVFSEFEKIHLSLAAEGKLPLAMVHALVRRAEKARIRSLKALGATTLGPGLRGFWHQLKRLRG
jgi:glycosyltransferase involved in cell wall biosynthesis